MKTIIALVAPPPFDKIGEKLYKNRIEYCEKNGCEFYFNNTPFKGSHHSWSTCEALIKLIEENLNTDTVIAHVGPEALMGNYYVTAEKLIDIYGSPKKEIFMLSEFSFPRAGQTEQLWMAPLSKGEKIKAVIIKEAIQIFSLSFLMTKCTQWTLDFFKGLMDEKEFHEGEIFKMLPQLIDRMQIAISLMYQSYAEVREKMSPIPAKEISCLPKGTGEVYKKMIRSMQRVTNHEYSDFHYGSTGIAIWCLSSSVDYDSIVQIIDENEKYILK